MLDLSRIRAGRWEGQITAPAEPKVEILHLDQPLPGLEVAEHGKGKWRLSLPIPPDVLHDGVQTFVIRDPGSGERLGHFSIVTGVPLEDDLRAEIDLLRAELDLLKAAFRRHCAETGA